MKQLVKMTKWFGYLYSVKIAQVKVPGIQTSCCSPPLLPHTTQRKAVHNTLFFYTWKEEIWLRNRVESSWISSG